MHFSLLFKCILYFIIKLLSAVYFIYRFASVDYIKHEERRNLITLHRYDAAAPLAKRRRCYLEIDDKYAKLLEQFKKSTITMREYLFELSLLVRPKRNQFKK